jgi:para-nitrobenzyl esterase
LGGVGVPVTAQEEVRVEIDSGELAGTTQDGVTIFKGIPYAAPPVGPLRWRPPQPVAPWARVRSARRYGPVAPQPGAGGPAMVSSEDCLYLNIWRPAQASEGRPVLVFVHGGGFATGSGSEPLYDGAELAKQGVVVVTFNYRLGILGFFAYPLLTAESPHDSSGNYGLLDQVAALEWVQRNIAQFGGDPTKVTLFGESTGGRSVSLLMVSPLARDLFHRAVAQSGAVRGVSTPLREREIVGEQLADAVGCADRPNPVGCLRARRFDELAPAAVGFDNGPIVDGWMIAEDPRVVYAEGRQYDVPMIIGGNADDGTFSMLGRRTQIGTVTDYHAYVRDTVGVGADEVLARYSAETDGDVFEALKQFDTDRGVSRHARQHGRWMSASRASTYVYLFARVSPHHRWSRLGATHTAELPYLFGNLQFAARQGRLSTIELADRRLSQAMMRYWVEFAEMGDPNGDGRPHWPVYGDDETLLVLDGEIATGGWPRPDGLDLLDRLLADEPVAEAIDSQHP